MNTQATFVFTILSSCCFVSVLSKDYFLYLQVTEAFDVPSSLDTLDTPDCFVNYYDINGNFIKKSTTVTSLNPLWNTAPVYVGTINSNSEITDLAFDIYDDDNPFGTDFIGRVTFSSFTLLEGTESKSLTLNNGVIVFYNKIVKESKCLGADVESGSEMISELGCKDYSMTTSYSSVTYTCEYDHEGDTCQVRRTLPQCPNFNTRAEAEAYCTNDIGSGISVSSSSTSTSYQCVEFLGICSGWGKIGPTSTPFPTRSPTRNPTRYPTQLTNYPTRSPTKSPTKSPTRFPTGSTSDTQYDYDYDTVSKSSRISPIGIQSFFVSLFLVVICFYSVLQ